MRPIICVNCQLEYRPEKNSVAAELMSGPDPYQLYAADLLHCPGCGHQIVAGLGARPIAEHYMPTYQIHVNVQGQRGHYRFWDDLHDKQRGTGETKGDTPPES